MYVLAFSPDSNKSSHPIRVLPFISDVVDNTKKIEKPLITNRKIRQPQPKKNKSSLSSLSLGKTHHARLGQYAANLWRDKVLTDVIIVVQNHEFKAHKAVLACYSPYFADVFVRPGFSDVHYMNRKRTANNFALVYRLKCSENV
ncbi:BTB domain-containing protein [Nephila pilipes]|uniref:BTB domain-containing protein n=1 Tax=Nephila pilipes TaxID=299642 RepID=A0A8X6PWJ5_NEPPI|nr:BTB domain-containing protein [Nephila pilipes]